MKKIAIFLANGFEETEALGTVDILRRANIPVYTVSITDNLNVTGAHDITVMADKCFDEVDFSEIDMLVLPGGMPGSLNLDKHEGLKKKIEAFVATNKSVAAICAAPMVFGHIGVLEGKKATCYPGFEKEMHGATATHDKVTIDGNIITGKGPGLIFDFALAIVEKVAGEQVRKEVAQALLLS